MNDAGGMVTKIKELIRTVSFAPKFEIITKHKNKEYGFNSNPCRHLIKLCDDEACRLLKTIRRRTIESNMARFEK